MTRYCSLNLLPVELLYSLFSYFLAHEILLTFSDVSDYVNAVLLTYTSYHLNFKSIQKSDFDLICHRIQPNQVISLTISDDNDTPGLSELFLSRFQIKQFTQLRSLTLIQIEIDSLKLIFSDLYKLSQLRSLSFDIETIRHKYPIWNNNYSNESGQLKALLLETYTRVLPRLNRIYLNHSADLASIPLPHLYQLKLSKFSANELEIIFQNSPQLKSFDICLYMNRLDSEFTLPVNRLIRLNLKIENRRVSRDEMEQFLSHLLRLKYLELDIPAWTDVVDGYFWQVMSRSLLIFNFKFTGLIIHIHKTLDSFRTPFWLEKKRWFVAYLDYSLFSIPHFAPVHMDSRNLLHFRSTAPYHSFIYKHLNKFIVNAIPINKNYYLTHIKTLVLECSISFKILESIVDLNQVEHLIVTSLDNLLTLVPLESAMSELTKLTVKNNVTIDMIEQIRCYRFEQIRTLQIRITDKYMDCIIEELFHLFPRIEHLIYKSTIKSVGMMVRLINGFQYLSHASFCGDCSFVRKEGDFCQNPNSIIQYLEQHKQDNSTCRVYHSMNTQLPFSIHWMIEKQVNIFYEIKPSIRLSIMNWPWRRGYYWYRLKYILLCFLYNNLSLIQYLMQFLIYLPIITVILKPYYNNFDTYFLSFCSINTVFVTIFYNVFYRLSNFIIDDNVYIVFVCRVYVWFVYCLIVFLFSFFIQIIYDYIF